MISAVSREEGRTGMKRRRVGACAVLVAFAFLTGCPPGGGDEDESADAGPEQPSWQEAFDAHDRGWFLSVAGRSDDQMYAVGGEPGDGGMMRREGGDWRSVDLPDDVPLLTWVHCFEDGQPVVAGDDGTILWKRDGEWEVQQTPTDQNLWGVWGTSPENVWAVGGNGDEATGEPTVIRYDGTSWSTVEVPDLEHVDVHALFKVWGTGPDDVFIVGQQGLVLRWNGEELVEQFTGTSEDLISLWGTGGDNIVAIGGRSVGVVARWNGIEWTSTRLDGLPGMNGIWMQRPDRAWIAGVNGYLGSLDPEAPLETLEIVRIETQKNFHAIYGLDGAGLFSVGGTLTSRDGPFEGIAMERELTRATDP